MLIDRRDPATTTLATLNVNAPLDNILVHKGAHSILASRREDKNLDNAIKILTR